jgi:hypothetical protein
VAPHNDLVDAVVGSVVENLTRWFPDFSDSIEHNIVFRREIRRSRVNLGRPLLGGIVPALCDWQAPLLILTPSIRVRRMLQQLVSLGALAFRREPLDGIGQWDLKTVWERAPCPEYLP